MFCFIIFMILDQFIGNLYLKTFVLFFLVFLLFRIGFFILEKILLKLTIKTKTDLDDILLKKISNPLNLIIFFLSLKIVISSIDFSIGAEIIKTLSKFIFSAIAIITGYLIYSITDLIIGRMFKKISSKTKSTLDDNLFALVHSVLKIALIFIIVLYVLTIWGVEIMPLIGALGIAGIAVALALQPVLGNIFSGASMVLDRTIGIGDLVYLDSQTQGKVVKIGMRSTRILTFDNELIIVPNSVLAEGKIQNVAKPEPQTRVVIPFGVAYGSEIAQVKKLVLEEIEKMEFACKDPAPKIRFLEMADSSLNFKVYFYVETFDHRADAIDEANTRIYNALNREGIEIPFPQMDVNLKKE
jgi:MscS family membrane protein